MNLPPKSNMQEIDPAREQQQRVAAECHHQPSDSASLDALGCLSRSISHPVNNHINETMASTSEGTEDNGKNKFVILYYLLYKILFLQFK